jgi:hypothetical protein
VCDLDPDLTGNWSLTFNPIDADGGVTSIPNADVVTAHFLQKNANNAFNVGRVIWGSFSSSDPSFFGTLDIPQLNNNGGSKTGAALGCTLKINVPLAQTVTDDNTPQPPNRLSLSGRVVAPGALVGDDSSTVIMAADVSASNPIERHFVWTGARQ